MSLFGLFSNCGIMCCSDRDERRESQQVLSNSQHTNPDRMRQLIIESQKQNNSHGIGKYGNNQNTQNNNDDLIDGFIEITPIFHGPKSGTLSNGSSSEVEDDYCEIIGENRQSSSSISSYCSSSNQQVIQEFVSLPIKKNKKRRNDQLHGASGTGGYGTNDNQSYKASMRSRNSSQTPSQDGGSQSRLDKQSKRSTKVWTEEEDRLLRFYYSKHNGKWPAIANEMADRTASQCQQRWRRIKPSKIRRPWTPEEDSMVLQLIKQNGKNWGLISSQMDNRSGKQVRERYINKLDPELNNTQFNEEEDRTIIDKYYKIGPKWSEIAKYLTGRSENMVKNRFYSYIKKTFAINSLSGNNRTDNGSWQDANSSPRLNQDDKASSYASSLYNELDPSVNSGNIESEESSSEGEQYNQFSLGPNKGQQLGLVGNNNQRLQEDIFKPQYDNQMQFQQQQQSQQLFTNVPIQQQGNVYIQNPQQINQQQQQQQFYTYNQEGQQGQNKFGMNQSLNSQEYIKRNSNNAFKNEKVEEMFHTPRIALANNSSFFPTDMFIQQQRFQQDDLMNSSGQQQLGNNFFNGTPSPLILLSPAQMKTEQFSFTSNTPSRRFMLSNQNTPYTNPTSNQNMNNQNNAHFNFSSMTNQPNYQVTNQQQQTQYQQQFNQQSANYGQNYMQNQQLYQQSQPQNTKIESNIKVNIEESLDNLNINNSAAQTPTQNLHGTYFLPPISPGQNIMNDYQQQMFLQTTGEQQAQQQYYAQQNNNLQQNPRDELRLDVSSVSGREQHQQQQHQQQQQQQQQGGQYNQQLPLATPKIDRKQLKNMIVDLESQLQLLKVQQQFLTEDDNNM